MYVSICVGTVAARTGLTPPSLVESGRYVSKQVLCYVHTAGRTGERGNGGGGGNCASVKGLAAWLGRLRSGWPPELPRRQDDRRCRYLHRYVRALVLRTEKKKKEEEEEEEDGEESPRAARSFRGMLFSFLSFLSPPPLGLPVSAAFPFFFLLLSAGRWEISVDDEIRHTVHR